MARKRNVPALREEDAPLPWDKQPKEPTKAFHAFSLYRDLGPARSLTKVGEIGEESGVFSPAMVERWSPAWRWVERVDAWDRDQDRRRQAERDTAIAQARRTEAMAGTLLLGAALRRLRGDRGAEGISPVEALDVSTLDPGEVARFAEIGAKLQRSGLGDAPLDLKGAIFVAGPAVQDLARNLLLLAIERVESAARAVAELNGKATPVEVAGIVARHQDALVEDSEALFRRTLRAG